MVRHRQEMINGLANIIREVMSRTALHTDTIHGNFDFDNKKFRIETVEVTYSDIESVTDAAEILRFATQQVFGTCMLVESGLKDEEFQCGPAMLEIEGFMGGLNFEIEREG